MLYYSGNIIKIGPILTEINAFEILGTNNLSSVRHCTALYGTLRHNSRAHYGGTLLETLVVFLRSELGGNLRNEIQRNFFFKSIWTRPLRDLYLRVLNTVIFLGTWWYTVVHRESKFFLASSREVAEETHTR